MIGSTLLYKILIGVELSRFVGKKLRDKTKLNKMQSDKTSEL